MKRSKMKLAVLFLVLTMMMTLVACAGDDVGSEETTVSTEETTTSDTEAAQETEATEEVEADTDQESTEAPAMTIPTGEGPLALDYSVEPEAYVGEWTLVNAYTANDGIIETLEDACVLEIETSIDANKLVDEAAYLHADAVNLKGSLTFNNEGIEVEPYKCSGRWTDWSIVDIKGEGEAYFYGAIEFKVRDDDEGVFFDTMTGVAVEDMELFDVLGLTTEGQLILGYSEDKILRDGNAEWAYAYIFEKK